MYSNFRNRPGSISNTSTVSNAVPNAWSDPSTSSGEGLGWEVQDDYKPAATLQRGGYGGTFADPDGYVWNVTPSRPPTATVEEPLR
jgi:hypothetical protein